MQDHDQLPSGAVFQHWQDTTRYARQWHVDARSPAASDANPGSPEAPLATIQAAAEQVAPGEAVVIHGGIYREWVRPRRGGDGPEAMICFQAAPGEEVVIRASDVWTPSWEAWRVSRQGATLWLAELPVEQLVGYNPFLAANIARSSWFPWQQRTLDELHRAQLRRGLVWQDGRRLVQVHDQRDLRQGEGRFFVSDDGLRLCLRPYGDVDPATSSWEVSTRMHCLAPELTGLGYIALRGLICEHAGNGVPFPQRGAISTTIGHHWIIEDCTVREVNALGIDIGTQNDLRSGGARSYQRMTGPGSGGHIVRRNHIHHCGIAGLAGCGGVDGSLIEDNCIEDLGDLDLEHVYEAAAIKLHGVRGALIRGNRLRHLRHCCGIWLDHCCVDNRISGNIIYDVATLLAGIYIEVSPEPNQADGNLLWNLRDVEGNDPPKDDTPGGLGIAGDMTDETRICDNLLIGIAGHAAISLYLAQKGRLIKGATAMSRGHEVRGNCVVASPRRVFLARPGYSLCDGNIYAALSAYAGWGSFVTIDGDRQAAFDLAAWRRWWGYDLNGREEAFTLQVREVDGRLALRMQTADGATVDCHGLPVLSPGQWQTLTEGGEVVVG